MKQGADQKHQSQFLIKVPSLGRVTTKHQSFCVYVESAAITKVGGK